MRSFPWLRFRPEVIDDERVLRLAFADRWHYVALLCCNRLGMLDRGDPPELLRRKLAVKMGLPLGQLNPVLRRIAAADLITLEPLQILDSAGKPQRPIPSLWAVIQARIFARDDYTCIYCSARGGSLECDHIVPISRGGSNEDQNLATACLPCNRSKRDKLLSEWLAERGRAVA